MYSHTVDWLLELMGPPLTVPRGWAWSQHTTAEVQTFSLFLPTHNPWEVGPSGDVLTPVAVADHSPRLSLESPHSHSPKPGSFRQPCTVFRVSLMLR